MMVAVMKWIAKGSKGLVLLRLTRAASETIYPESLQFEYGKGYVHGDPHADTVIITSGRGIYEGLNAQKALREQGREIAVVDMPSFDADLAAQLTQQGKRILFAEQNNGFLFASYLDEMYRRGIAWSPEKITTLSTRTRAGSYTHLGGYGALAASAEQEEALRPFHTIVQPLWKRSVPGYLWR